MARQHEFDNHINAIYNQHIVCNSYDDLIMMQKQYCEGVIEDNKYNKLLSKGNPIVLGFLYGEFVEAEKKGLEIIYKICIEDIEGYIPIYKVVELLGNLLKNAIEDLVESERKKLYVTMIEEEKMLRIEVANETETISYEEITSFFRKGFSKKGAKRGYGLYNVKNICDQYKINIICVEEYLDDTKVLNFKLEIQKPFN